MDYGRGNRSRQANETVFHAGRAASCPNEKSGLRYPLPAFWTIGPVFQTWPGLKDAGKNTGIELRDMAIIVSTTYGCSQTDLDYFDTVMTDGGKSASPALFSYTLPNSFLGEASCRFGLTGASFVVNEFPPMGLSGLKAAMDGISFNEFENALVGFCEPGCPSGFENNSGTAPGALFFMIDRIEKSVHPPYGTVELNSRNDVLFNGKQIRDLVNLARECLLVKC
jgi:3-oxoacyl-[acyl-carrier-protein] synthase II